MKKILLSVFIFTCISICGKNKGSISANEKDYSELKICRLEKITKKEKMPLSDLLESCALIHFEDVDAALFKPWFTTVSDKYIGVRQEGNPFKLFDRKGKFLCDVGKKGNGPGEYSISLYDDIIDDKNELIYLAPMTGKKILIYNTSGKFVKSYESPYSLNKPKMHLSNGILSVIHMPFNKDEPFAIQFNSEGKIIQKLLPPANLIVKDFNGEIFNTRNTRAFEFLHTSSDTLYHYNIKENKIEPVYSIATKQSEKLFKQYIELNNKYITNVFGKGVVFTDNQSNASSFIEVVNDYYGNLPVNISVITLRNGWFVQNLEPGQLIDMIEKRLKESNCTQKEKQELNKLLSVLDENSNNVLFLGKLK